MGWVFKRGGQQLKDQYFGDINDYRKYGLLRSLIKASGLALGVCWLRTKNDQRRDGEFRQYLLNPSRWRCHDPELYDALTRLLKPGVERSVLRAEAWEILPKATYHHHFLNDDAASRNAYFEEASKYLRNCPLIFFDPDNGLEVKSVEKGFRRSSKYLYWHEVESTFSRGHSLIVYQHFPMKPRRKFIDDISKQLKEKLDAPLVDSFRTSHVVFFLVAQPKHVKHFEAAHKFIQSSWAGQIWPVAHVASRT